MPPESPNPIVLYDGICGLCNRAVQFILQRDKKDRFRFAALQSDFARSLLQKHGITNNDLDTLYLVLNHGLPEEKLLERSTASIAIHRELGPFWRVLANCYSILPLSVRDWGYNLIARHRYRIFGKYDTCPIPKPGDRRKFLDVV
jgi:predicted DCC family thiol-disulfide oxidoreductase YuxK